MEQMKMQKKTNLLKLNIFVLKDIKPFKLNNKLNFENNFLNKIMEFSHYLSLNFDNFYFLVFEIVANCLACALIYFLLYKI